MRTLATPAVLRRYRRPLAAPAFALILALSVGEAGALVREQLSWTTYDVPVHAGRVFPQLLAGSPLPAHPRNRKPIGTTSPRMNWVYYNAIGEDRLCRVTAVTVDLHTTITLPRIVGADAAQQAAFARFLAALREHELGHYRIGREEAQATEHMLRSLPASRDCAALQTLANERARRIQEQYMEKQAQFDAESGRARDVPMDF